jgi:hypothetical protein
MMANPHTSQNCEKNHDDNMIPYQQLMFDISILSIYLFK